MKLLGEGTFGKVLQCWDRIRKAYVAIKVVRAIKKYCDAARDEIRILEDIKRRDPADNKYEIVFFISFHMYSFHLSISLFLSITA